MTPGLERAADLVALGAPSELYEGFREDWRAMTWAQRAFFWVDQCSRYGRCGRQRCSLQLLDGVATIPRDLTIQTDGWDRAALWIGADGLAHSERTFSERPHPTLPLSVLLDTAVRCGLLAEHRQMR